MYGDACRTNASEWLHSGDIADKWGSLSKGADAFYRPSATYSKRSGLIRDLRSKIADAQIAADDFISAPTQLATDGAEFVINSLPEGCLDFRIAISQSGEINFFNGRDDDLFQLLIDVDGTLSFYGVLNGRDWGGSDLAPADFPYMKLLHIVDQHK